MGAELAPISLATACYIWAAIVFAQQQKWGLSLVYICYAIANAAMLIIAERGG